VNLLIDQNISPRVVSYLLEDRLNFFHVRDVGLTDVEDVQIFKWAKESGIDALVTLDSDFHKIVLRVGIPPKIIWLRGQNCDTRSLALKINLHFEQILSCGPEPESEILEIY
jgi:predicted nuclease of predicted toxin-antitoxin system